jgi:hypothetical protein
MSSYAQLRLDGQTGRAPAFDVLWFEAVFAAFDRLHDALSAGCETAVLPVAPDDMVGWLEDIIYTAQESIVEIRTQERNPVRKAVQHG